MKITENWLQLKVNRYEDGNYEAYEALTDNRFVTPYWSCMQEWIRKLIDETTLVIEEQKTGGKQ
jgi:hypothetical protein